MTGGLHARHEIDFVYHRSPGGSDRAFLAGLKAGQIWGSTDAAGRVTVPPVDWDPAHGVASSGFVRVADVGTVTSWTWPADPERMADAGAGRAPGAAQAFALIRLRGADTGLLHFVDVADQDQMWTGMTVRADWRPERTGHITDIRAFVPCTGEDTDDRTGDESPHAPGPPGPEPDLAVTSDLRLGYSYEPGLALSRFLRALSERRIEGGRCPSCAGVYVPCRSKCPACGVGPLTPVEMPHRGTVTTFTVVHLPFHGMTLELPFVCAWIRLHGASVPFAHLLGGIPPDEVRAGMQVEAVWAEDRDLGPTWESIRFFKPMAGSEPAGPELA